MSRYTVTPWRTPSDLLTIRTQLFSPTADPSQRHRAISRIHAWKLRGNLPHAVESTALLIDAQMHHENSSLDSPQQRGRAGNSHFSIRAVYTAAFTRFVTGFCDIGRAKEGYLQPSSMLDVAKQIGMPTEFVALRHEATHEEMPSLSRLVEATERGLEWLWNVYWAGLEESTSEAGVKVGREEFDVAALRDELKTVLKEFRRFRRDAVHRRTNRNKPNQERVAYTCETCTQLCCGREAALALLATVLLEDGMMIPTKRVPHSGLEGGILMWNDLIDSLFVANPTFPPIFFRRAVEILMSDAVADDDDDGYADGLAVWVGHLLDDRDYRKILPYSVRSSMMKMLCMNPGHSASSLGKSLIGFDDELREDWSEVWLSTQLTENELQLESDVAGVYEDEDLERALQRAGQGEAILDEIAPLKPPMDVDASLSKGWRRAPHPPTVPIGVVV